MRAETPVSVQVSVIIPTFNRPEPLRLCLAALEQQQYPAEKFEVLVVDDGGTANTRAVIAPFRSMQIILLTQPNRGPAAARNLAAGKARGELLAFTDDDCRPHPLWLSSAVRKVRGAEPVCFGGRTLNGCSSNPLSEASQAVQDAMHNHFNSDPGNCWFFPSNNLFVTRSAFLAIGGFNESFRISEDREFCDRWIASGHRLQYCPDAVVSHHHNLDPASLFAQHYAYGKGAHQHHCLRKSRTGRGLVVYPGFYGKLLEYPFRRRPFSALLLLGLLFTQIATAAGYASSILRHSVASKKHFPLTSRWNFRKDYP